MAACQPDAEKYLINYSLNQSISRRKSVLETRKKLSFWRQLYDSVFSTLGPPSLLNIFVITLLGQRFHPITETTELFPSVIEFLIHLLVMLLVSDFILYWGHRVQHMNSYLWKHCHSYHHQIVTPTAISTASIEQTDATLQAGIPVLIAFLVTRPHPLTFHACLSLRFLDNVMNHSGIDFNQIPSPIKTHPNDLPFSSFASLSRSLGKISLFLAWFLTLITFKNSPLRAPTSHHDYHHRYINFTTNSKNFGEYFVIWDQLFGTYSQALAMKQKK
jgi:sterol desaturase/sphingolipid hydroxylase (fatty acid hydroxylase superfamily)